MIQTRTRPVTWDADTPRAANADEDAADMQTPRAAPCARAAVPTPSASHVLAHRPSTSSPSHPRPLSPFPRCPASRHVYTARTPRPSPEHKREEAMEDAGWRRGVGVGSGRPVGGCERTHTLVLGGDAPPRATASDFRDILAPRVCVSVWACVAGELARDLRRLGSRFPAAGVENIALLAPSHRRVRLPRRTRVQASNYPTVTRPHTLPPQLHVHGGVTGFALK
ncbi:hypothetical protein B0H11DRAFT_2239447 [Mycena galericulata]|nr:hypothetical protein B0H11DRAFT_2239447 [Mycena galericulata]